MPDRVKELFGSAADWWKHFTRKQQMIIVSSVLVVVIAIGILGFILMKPEMTVLRTCESAKEAGSVQELLDGAGIYNTVSDNGLVFSVKKKDQAAATILLGSNAIATDDQQLSDILNGSLSTTEADKSKLYKEYMENKLTRILESLDNVEKATIMLDIPTDDGTLIAQQKEKSAEIFLTLDGDMDDEQATGLARMVATGLGNKTTDNISIMDSNMNLLYSGGMDGTTMASGASYSQLSTQQKVESRVISSVKKVLLGTGTFKSAEIAVHLPLNFGETKTTRKDYSVPDGREQGYLKQDSTYDAETTSGNGGVPGTGSNDEDGPTYVVTDENGSTHTVSDSSRQYALNEEITESVESHIGEIISENASIAVSVLQPRKYDEDTLRRDGALEDMTFDEYRAQIESQEREVMEVDDDIITLVSNATGIATDRITVVSYEEPVFIPSRGSGRTLSDYLEIALAVLIFALLGFVVFMSTRKDKAAELEPELSVETLLQTTKENNEEESLEDIGFKDKSEARVLIEKFVDEKPEAVASLLRNWLNEDWD